jgi:streptomycin 6-kinase
VIAVPQTFRDMPRWWHDEAGRAWLDRLPALVSEACARWGLTVDGPVLHGSNALVVLVRHGSQQVTVRLTPPGDDLAAETAALRHWDGRGVVRLLDVDLTLGACLLERLDHTRSLISEPVLQAVATLGSLTHTLAVPAPADAPSTRDLAAEAAESFGRQWRDLGQPTPRRLLEAAVAGAAALAEAEPGRSSVNGDLHFEQVLAGSRYPWTVVDPVLLRGDPEYDIGRVLWTRLDELADDRDVHAAFRVFADAASVPPERARSWVVVRSMSYLLWGLRRGLTWDPPKCQRLLELFS